MNKTAIKNFAVWARNKLISDISYKAGLMGITENGIKSALPQSTKDIEFYDVGTKEPHAVSGKALSQRMRLAELIKHKAADSDYKTAYSSVIEEVAYTWFNRLIAVRFMEVNDYLPSHIRVLSSESGTKLEPDLVTTPFNAELELTDAEKERIYFLKNNSSLENDKELFNMLFIKQCNALNAILPKLFEKTEDYSELLLNISATDPNGVVYRLVHDIDEDDFNIDKGGQVEIIGWLYQYYNTEPKDAVFEGLKKNIKITKETIPAATQLFTPDWIVRYMVENSLGRLWLEGHPNDELKSGWKYYLDEAEQEADVQAQLDKIREEYKTIKPEDIKVIDPCMGSGHILVYAFDVLMQIYESAGYTQRDAAKGILENNLYGLDIDDRAFQLAYFAVMMKARQYNRRILNGETDCHVYSIQESNGINRAQLKYFGAYLSEMERNTAMLQIQGLLDTFADAKEYGSILNVESCSWDLLRRFTAETSEDGQMSLDSIGLEATKEQLQLLIEIGAMMTQKYDVVVTNPPYMGSSNMDIKLINFVKKNYPDSKSDLFAAFIEKGFSLLSANGFLAYITMQAWMFLSSYCELRGKLSQKTIISLIQIGFNSFPELNSQIAHAVSFIIKNNDINNYNGKYFNLNTGKTTDDKNSVFLSKVDNNEFYTNASKEFLDIPNVNFAYWLSVKEKRALNNSIKLGEKIDIRQGLATGNNEKFLKEWFEVSCYDILLNCKSIQELHNTEKKYVPYNKGGDFRRWYGNNENVIRFDKKCYNELLAVGNHLPSRDYYFRRGITWSLIATNNFAARLSSGGFVFDVGGSSGFPSNDLYYYLGLLCSKIAYNFLQAFNPTINFQVGDIKNIPVITSAENKDAIENLVCETVNLEKTDWDSFETSWDFVKHPLITYRCGAGYADVPIEKWQYRVADAYNSWANNAESQFNILKSNEEEINRIFIDIYGLQDELTPKVEDKYVTIRKADLGRDIRSLISYAVGCMFGRYSLDVDGLAFAGGDWDDSKYSSYIPDKDNILPITDEEYFEDDVVGRFIDFVKTVYGAATLEENLDFIAKALGSKGSTSREVIRNYFLNDFFKNHCQIYQKRPIYWLFDSGKQNGFKALIYMHRYDENTVGNMRVDYLHRMERVYESELARMQDIIDNSTDAREVTAAVKRKEKLQKQLKECKDYDEKIAHLALARIPIDLDDGVKVNYEKVQTVDGKKYPVLAEI